MYLSRLCTYLGYVLISAMYSSRLCTHLGYVLIQVVYVKRLLTFYDIRNGVEFDMAQDRNDPRVLSSPPRGPNFEQDPPVARSNLE